MQMFGTAMAGEDLNGTERSPADQEKAARIREKYSRS